MNKKDLPLNVLHALSPFVKMKGKLFTVKDDPEENYMIALDKDENSNFYYVIENYEYSGNEYVFNVTYSPADATSVKPNSVRVGEKALTTHFNKWIAFLEEYNSVSSFYDDPILESYEEEFFTNFEFIDEEADIRPFKTTQILQLDYLLEQVSTRLIEMVDENNREEIESIITEITEVRENLPTRPQKWIAEHVSKIYAKIAKQGIKFMKEFWTEGKKEIIKNIVKGLIEHGPDMFN
ncbi:hypothetical protein ACWKWW_08170 [Chryseobacterium cucumeris]